MQVSAAQHVRGARRQGRDKAIGQAKLAAQRDGRALLREQCVGPAVDHPSIESISADDAARSVARFDESDVDVTALQFVSCRQTGNASADHDYFALVHGSLFVVLRSSSISAVIRSP